VTVIGASLGALDGGAGCAAAAEAIAIAPTYAPANAIGDAPTDVPTSARPSSFPLPSSGRSRQEASGLVEACLPFDERGASAAGGAEARGKRLRDGTARFDGAPAVMESARHARAAGELGPFHRTRAARAGHRPEATVGQRALHASAGARLEGRGGARLGPQGRRAPRRQRLCRPGVAQASGVDPVRSRRADRQPRAGRGRRKRPRLPRRESVARRRSRLPHRWPPGAGRGRSRSTSCPPRLPPPTAEATRRA
jgi:hypothetical protein